MASSLDFNVIDTNTPKTIALLDVSIYDGSILLPLITITAPGFKPKSIIFKPKKINVFNSNTLGITNVTTVSNLSDLPDGLYKATYAITGASVDKIWMKVDKLICLFGQVLLKMDILCDGTNPHLNQMRDIEFLIQASVASANVCNTKTAVDLYRRAADELNELNKRC